MKAFLSLLLGIVALTSSIHFATEYGDHSPVLIISAICMLLAIVLAFDGGEKHGRKQQQKDMVEAIEKNNSLLRTEMDKAYAEGCCSKCENNPFAGH